MVVAPREARIRVTMERLRLDEKAAAAEMDATDADRDRYMEKWYKRRRQDPSNYHLVLNTDWLGYDGAAHLVVAVARARGWG
jgi:cytidylate kinase